MTRSATAYTPEFIDRCFTAWYSAGRPESIGDYMDVFPVDEHGRNPTIHSLKKWRKLYGWDNHADDLDSRAIQIRDDYLVMTKANILKKQADDAALIADKALKYLVSGTFDTSSSAVSAYFRATEEQRLAIGISELVVKMSKMGNEELEREIASRLSRLEIIEGETEDIGDSSNTNETPSNP